MLMKVSLGALPNLSSQTAYHFMAMRMLAGTSSCFALSCGLLPQEALVIIAEKHKPFFFMLALCPPLDLHHA